MKISTQWWRGRRLDPFHLNSRMGYARVLRIGRFVLHFDYRSRAQRNYMPNQEAV